MSTIDLFNDKLPLGSDFRYESKFVETEKEIDKLANANTSHGVDWNKVKENSYDILTTSSKDMKVFCWLLFSYFRDQDFENFLKEGENFKLLVGEHFNDLFPKSKKARSSSFLWLISKVTNFINQNDDIFKALPQSDIRNINKFFTDIDDITKDFDLNIYIELKMVIKLLSKFFKDENPPLENNSTTDQSSENESSNHTEESKVKEKNTDVNNNNEDSNNNNHLNDSHTIAHNISADTLDNLTMEELKSQSFKYLKNFLSVNAVDKNINADYIKINRFISWLDILNAPQYDSEKAIMLASPHEHVITGINLKIENKNYMEAFFDIENTIITSPFWITAHYLSYTCLVNLEFPELANLVKNQILQITLLDRDIINCFFNNGLPLADEQTKNWLNEGIKPIENNENNSHNENNKNNPNNISPKPMEGMSPQTEKSETSNRLETATAEQKQIFASSGSLAQDMKILQEEYLYAPSAQAKVITRLKQARVCIDNHMYTLAFQISSEVEKELIKLKIDMWDPPLYCDSLLLMNESLSYIYDANHHQEIFQYLNQKLSLLNPTVLLK